MTAVHVAEQNHGVVSMYSAPVAAAAASSGCWNEVVAFAAVSEQAWMSSVCFERQTGGDWERIGMSPRMTLRMPGTGISSKSLVTPACQADCEKKFVVEGPRLGVL